MSLVDWYPQGIEGEVKRILMAEGKKRTVTREECQAWARAFIQARIPSWRPGQPLQHKQAQKLGEAFEARLVQVRGELPRPARQKSTRRRMP